MSEWILTYGWIIPVLAGLFLAVGYRVGNEKQWSLYAGSLLAAVAGILMGLLSGKSMQEIIVILLLYCCIYLWPKGGKSE